MINMRLICNSQPQLLENYEVTKYNCTQPRAIVARHLDVWLETLPSICYEVVSV